MTPTEALVVLAVIGIRLIAPLFMIRFPLPTILVCLVADAVDQTIFQATIGGDLTWYQSYDKALDVYYLSFAYISTLTNWRDENAFQVSRFLFFWRLVGVTLFEMTQWRVLLLLFPNAFEYVFIVYEAIRTRWNPTRMAALVVVGIALGITLFVKVPQETWIHVLQLDLTDTLASFPVLYGVLVAVIVVAVLGVRQVARRSPDPDWGFTLDVRRHVPRGDSLGLVTARLFDPILLEKVVFLSLTGVVLAHMVPELSVSNVRIGVTVAVLVVINAVVTELWHNRRGGWQTTFGEFCAVFAVNVLLIALLPEFLLADGLPDGDSGLLVLMISLLATMYDRGRDRREPVDEPAHPWREAWQEWQARRAGRVAAGS